MQGSHSPRRSRLTASLPWSLSVLVALGSEPVSAQEDMRLVIATNLACRAEPNRSAPVVRGLRMGEVILASERPEDDGDPWFLDQWRRCWVFGPLTAGWQDREQALLRAADRILAGTDDVPFEDFVAVDNLLVQTRVRGHLGATVLEESPLLQVRRLQVLHAAAGARDAWPGAVARDPLRSAWFFNNRDAFQYHEPAGRWVVVSETYWELFERHRDSEWAEEIAWAATEGSVLGDECDGPCELEWIMRTTGRYWAAFPQGRWVDEALARATRKAEFGARMGCFESRAEEAREQARRVRDSLSRVTAPERGALLAGVERIERACGVWGRP
jgi:hypothetical protein